MPLARASATKNRHTQWSFVPCYYCGSGTVVTHSCTPIGHPSAKNRRCRDLLQRVAFFLSQTASRSGRSCDSTISKRSDSHSGTLRHRDLTARLAAAPKSRRLFVKKLLPVRRHRSGRSGCRLIQWMTVRSVKLQAGDELLRSIVVKPMLARLEARDYRVTRSGVMLRCMLIW